jgi:hypothetical protein
VYEGADKIFSGNVKWDIGDNDDLTHSPEREPTLVVARI